MPYPCFKCDVELVAGAHFCHHCGAPNLLQHPHRRAGDRQQRQAAPPVEEEERYRIKRDIQEAATIPTGTRMIQTVLPPLPARDPTPLKSESWGARALATRPWARWWLWAAVCGIAFLSISSNIIIDFKDRLQGGGDVARIVTRLAARCPRDSKAQIMEYIERIQRSLPGQRTQLDAATLLEIALHDVPSSAGSCASVAAVLAKPDRFQSLVQ